MKAKVTSLSSTCSDNLGDTNFLALFASTNAIDHLTTTSDAQEVSNEDDEAIR